MHATNDEVRMTNDEPNCRSAVLPSSLSLDHSNFIYSSEIRDSEFVIPQRAAVRSHQSLIHHRIRHLEEPRDVGAVHIIARRSVLLRDSSTGRVNRLHDVEQPIVYFFAGPRDPHTVLRHLQAGRRDTTRVGRLTGTKKDLGVDELID